MKKPTIAPMAPSSKVLRKQYTQGLVSPKAVKDSSKRMFAHRSSAPSTRFASKISQLVSQISSPTATSQSSVRSSRGFTGSSQTSRSSSSGDSNPSVGSVGDTMISGKFIKEIVSYIQYVTRSLFRKDKQTAVQSWEELLEKIKAQGNSRAHHGATKIFAEIFFEFKDYTNALDNYKRTNTLCQTIINQIESNPNKDKDKKRKLKTMQKEKLYGYKQTGIWFQLLKDYQRALICFKLMLKLAWQLQDKEAELVSYDRMGMQHYYLGDMDKAAYYHDRMMRGKFESEISDIKKISLSSVKKTHMMQNRGNQLWQPASNKPVKAPVGAATLGNKGAVRRPAVPVIDNIQDISDTSINNLPSPRGGSNGCEALYVLANCPYDEDRGKNGMNRKGSLPNLHTKTHRPTYGTQRSASKEVLTMRKGIKSSVRPFIFVNHLSPNKNINNFQYLEPINMRKMKVLLSRFSSDLKNY